MLTAKMGAMVFNKKSRGELQQIASVFARSAVKKKSIWCDIYTTKSDKYKEVIYI